MARVAAETVTLSVSGHTVSHFQTGPLLAQNAYNSIIQFMERQQYIGRLSLYRVWSCWYTMQGVVTLISPVEPFATGIKSFDWLKFTLIS